MPAGAATDGDASSTSSTVDAATVDAPSDFKPLPAGLGTSTRRRRRRKKPLYRRPLVIVPAALLLIAVSAVAVVGYRMESLMSAVHAVSTPPPVVTDGTYMEQDDPDMPSTPVTVDTAPAREALASVDGAGVQAETGFTSRLQRAVSNSSDLVGGAAVAAGIKGSEGRPLTLLFMGVDARPGAAIDIGVRPDVLMVVRLDPNDGACRILSVPRDTRVELPGYGKSKINHALMVGGIPYQIMVTEQLLDVEIDHYMLIDFVAFEHMVDAVGGVTVVLPETLSKDGAVRFEEGTQHLDGAQALALARFRAPSSEGDLGRVERQWALLGGLADAVQGRDIVGDVNTMLPALEAHLRTDLTATDLTQIAKAYGKRCMSSNARSIDMVDGSRIRFHDPILNASLYYNVVTDATVEKRVDALLGDGPASPQGTPVPATPAPATPAPASPRAFDTDRGRRST